MQNKDDTLAEVRTSIFGLFLLFLFIDIFSFDSWKYNTYKQKDLAKPHHRTIMIFITNYHIGNVPLHVIRKYTSDYPDKKL